MNAILVHGAYGSPADNWFPWLRQELERTGYSVLAPKFPTPQNQTLKNWLAVFGKEAVRMDESSVVVGHSLGVAFLLGIVERLYVPIKAAFFVSGFASPLGNPEFDKINRTFIARKFDWSRIKGNCRNFLLFHSDDDPYVPLEKALGLSELLDAPLILVKNAGHFNKESGYSSFPLLLEKISSL